MSWSSTATLYGIQSGTLIKIGVARDMRRRIEQFRLYNPHPLKIVIRRSIFLRYVFQVEKRTHALLEQHACGHEWFEAPLATVRRALQLAIDEAEQRDLAIRLADASARREREQSTVEKPLVAATN
jgi:hypothetical protein